MHSFLLHSKNLNNSVIYSNTHFLSHSQICGSADLVCTVCLYAEGALTLWVRFFLWRLKVEQEDHPNHTCKVKSLCVFHIC